MNKAFKETDYHKNTVLYLKILGWVYFLKYAANTLAKEGVLKGIYFTADNPGYIFKKFIEWGSTTGPSIWYFVCAFLICTFLAQILENRRILQKEVQVLYIFSSCYLAFKVFALMKWGFTIGYFNVVDAIAIFVILSQIKFAGNVFEEKTGPTKTRKLDMC